MEITIDIDEELLCEFDGAARANNITRATAVRGAITAWVSQARRDATLRELFDPEFSPES
jgi:metal-responsive CopG/Arc/MetJ family transcriptional regulator